MVITDNLRGSAMMAAAMCAFTLNDACMKAVTAELPLYQTIMLRGFLTLVALAILAPRLGGLRFRLSGDDRRTMLWRTVGEILATVFFLTALTKMPFANLSAIMQALPLA
ncbi:MAG: EamA/RhaT family transporter, partial [Rhodobacteraceae bacterium]|nr:EamA/RhaT family transporter [Paracoccaceae bacterium]